MKVGWSITPLGWILIVVLATVLLYHIVTKLKRPPKENY